MKVCSKCKNEKDIGCFSKHKGNKDGKSCWCKSCCQTYRENSREKQAGYDKKYKQNNRKKLAEDAKEFYKNNKELYRRYRQDNKEKIAKYHAEYGPRCWLRSRDKVYRTKYGISLEDYDRMWELQKGLCYICGQPETQKNNKWLAVDHDRVTGKVRKLLCFRCNIALGNYEAKKERFEEYLLEI